MPQITEDRTIFFRDNLDLLLKVLDELTSLGRDYHLPDFTSRVEAYQHRIRNCRKQGKLMDIADDEA